MSPISVAPKLTFCTILKNITKTNIILTFCSLVKIHLEKSKKTFVARLRRNGRHARELSHVCGGFNEKKLARTFASIFLSRCSRHINCYASIFRASKKSACSPGAVNEINKTYSTSAVALTVRFLSYVCGGVARKLRNIYFSQLKKRWIS